jgi:CYTH domain-containing protein
MPTEIERKFLVLNDSWRGDSAGVGIAQGYLSQDPDRTVRVRMAGEKAWITIKGRTQGISRAEFEYEIPPGEARELLELCLPSVIDKTRYLVRHGGHVWEVDVFHGENDGLTVAEVELSSEVDMPEMPAWLGAEVSDDRRYFNSQLARYPFTRWAAISQE